MAFNLDELKNKKENVTTLYLNKLKGILESEEFEDRLQEYLEEEIEKGSSNAIIIFEVSKTDRSEVFLELKSYNMSFSYEFCQDSQDKIGNLKQYIELIENKLDELRLHHKEHFVVSNNEFDNIVEHSTKEYKFFIRLNFE